MSRISDYTDDPASQTSSFKQNFDFVSPEEIQFFNETLLHDFEQLNRKSFVFGLQVPVELQKWMDLHLQCHLPPEPPTFFRGLLVLREVNCKTAPPNIKLQSIPTFLFPRHHFHDLFHPQVENVRMVDRFNNKNSIVGTLYLTATHLIFVDPEANKETWILHMHIASVEKLPLSTTGSRLLIRCKTFLSVTFVIAKERDSHDVYSTLIKLCQPVNIQSLYCFQFTSSSDGQPKSSGWDYFKLETEFRRQKVPNNEWQLSNMNSDYTMCDTYPNLMFVPAAADKTILVGSSRFRSKGRLPVLTYLHPNKGSICRCSQPLSGFSARCIEDEQMLQEIRKTNPNSSILYVVDTRPRVSDDTIHRQLHNLSSISFLRSMRWPIEQRGKATRTNCSMKIRNSTFLASRTSTPCGRVSRSS